MAHREQEFRDSCGLCDEPATTTCTRCGLPLCKAHAPQDPEERCTDCEGELYVANAKRGRIRGALASLGVAAGSVAGAVAAFALAGWGTTVMAGVLGAAATAFTATHAGTGSRSKRRRQKFLREKKPKYEAAVGENRPPR